MTGQETCGVCGDTGTHFPVGAEYGCYCCDCYGCDDPYWFGEPCDGNRGAA